MSPTERVIRGVPASPGVAEGMVQVVSLTSPAAEFREGSILVAKMTEPPMVPMMIRAAAIVTDLGGITSHPAIVSREMGIPCVVATKIATSTLVDGQRVRVDGDAGTVTVIEDSA